MIIRAEASDDFAGIDAVLNAAFGGTYESGLVRKLRQTEYYIPERALVAVDEDGGVVGHVVLSRATIEARGRDPVECLVLGPVAVAPEVQMQGVGKALVRRVLEGVEEAVAVLGHPTYYPKFGFEPAWKHDVYPPLPWANDHFMVLPHGGKRGMVRYPAPWGIGVNKDTIEVRRARHDDMPQLARVFAVSFRWAMSQIPNLHSAQEDVEFYSGPLFQENEVYLAHDGEHTVGHIGFNAQTQFVNHLYVLPVAHGHGIGTRLLRIAQDKCDRLQLWTFQANAEARAFYKGQGFREVKFTEGEGNEEKEPDVLLEWTRTHQ